MASAIPEGAFRIEVSATYNQNTIPRELRQGEALPPETWGEVIVEEGELALRVGGHDPGVTPGQPGIIPPGQTYRLEERGGPVLFHIEYFHEPKLNDAALLASALGGRPRPT